MKYLITLLFLPVIGFGEKDPIKTAFDGRTAVGIGTVKGLSVSESIKTVYDTIKVIMLLCDTANKVHYKKEAERIWKQGGVPPGKVFDTGFVKNKSIYWQYGYEVRKKFFFSPSYYYDHVVYLDADKHPLPKNIIVWKSKETKRPSYRKLNLKY